MEEIWKEIEGYEGLYEISTTGLVKSLGRFVQYVGKRNGPRWYKEKILKILKLFNTSSGKDDDFYLAVNLTKNKNHFPYRIHRMVAVAFIPNPLNLPQVNHKDGNRLNNNVTNLEWCNIRENSSHYFHRSRSKPKLIGAYKRKSGKWQARICVNGQDVYLGQFDSEELAGQAYQEALLKNNFSNRYAKIT